jgi:alpha-L-fucosidase
MGVGEKTAETVELPQPVLGNAGFDAAELAPWKVTQGKAWRVAEPTHGSGGALELGAGLCEVEQAVALVPQRRYRLSAWIRTASGAEEARIGVRGHGKGEKATATSWVSYRHTEMFFDTGRDPSGARVFLQRPSGVEPAWVDGVELECVGVAQSLRYQGVRNSIALPTRREVVEQMGVAQLPDEKLKWLLDEKFGMFIHWGLYAGPQRGEWHRYADSVPEAEYARLATPESEDAYFSADRFDPAAWAQLAKDAGMKWLVLTARHHDGFNLFASPHPNAWHSQATHGRDFVREYADAVRRAGLRVGLYFSPLNWRYPGVFDVTGKGAKPNNLGCATDAANRENARVFKEENYANVRHLMSAYGEISAMYWDGGWLGHSGSDADAAYFHEPGRYMEPDNGWRVDERWVEREEGTGRRLGIMGMVRKLQPNCVTNTRYCWIGDVFDEEQGPPPTGPMRADVYGKGITMGSSWGYCEARLVMYSRDLIIEYLINSIVRNMFFLFNVGPDRHGVIPGKVAARLREVGAWVGRMAPAIYGTRAGPWHPEDGEYGYTYRDRTVFVHVLAGHRGDEFVVPPVGELVPLRAWTVFDGKPVAFGLREDRTVLLSGLDRSQSAVDTIVAVEFDVPVMTYAGESVEMRP